MSLFPYQSRPLRTRDLLISDTRPRKNKTRSPARNPYMGAGLGRCLSVKSRTTLPSIREKELSGTAFVHGERKTIGREKGKGRLGSLSLFCPVFLLEFIYVCVCVRIWLVRNVVTRSWMCAYRWTGKISGTTKKLDMVGRRY